MAARRPIVIVSGTLKELPVGDTVAGASGGSGLAKYAIVGALVAGALTPRWYPDHSITLSSVYFSLGTAPTGSAVIDVRKNGTSIFSSTLPTCTVGNNKSSAVAVTTTVDPTDYLTVAVTSASGADATVCLVYT